MKERGYSAIALVNPKTNANVGGAMRAAHCFGASMLMTIGGRYSHQITDTMKAYRHMPVINTNNFRQSIPYSCIPVAVELIKGARDLRDFTHPERAIYVFGPEDGTLGKSITDHCKYIIQIPTNRCLNLAATVNVVLYDRLLKRGK